MNQAKPIPALSLEVYTYEEAAKALGLSVDTFQVAVKAGKVAKWKDGRNVRFCREALLQYWLDHQLEARGGGEMGPEQAGVLRRLLEPMVEAAVQAAFAAREAQSREEIAA